MSTVDLSHGNSKVPPLLGPSLKDIPPTVVDLAPPTAPTITAAPSFQGAHLTNLGLVGAPNGSLLEQNQIAIILQRQAALLMPEAGIPDPAVALQPRWQAMAREIIGALQRDSGPATHYYLNQGIDECRFTAALNGVITNPEYWREGESGAALATAVLPLLLERIEAQRITAVAAQAVELGERLGQRRAQGANEEEITAQRTALSTLLSTHAELFQRPEYAAFLTDINQQAQRAETRAYSEQIQGERLTVRRQAQQEALNIVALPADDPQRAQRLSSFIEGLQARPLFQGPAGVERLNLLRGQMERWCTLSTQQLTLEMEICQEVQSFASDQVMNLALGDMQAHQQRLAQFERVMARPEVRDYLNSQLHPENQRFLLELNELEAMAREDAESRYGTADNPGRALQEMMVLMEALQSDCLDEPTLLALLRSADEAQRNALLRLGARELRRMGRLSDEQERIAQGEGGELAALRDYLLALPLQERQRERMVLLLNGNVTQYDVSVLNENLTRHAEFQTRQAALDAQLASNELTAERHTAAIELLALERIASRDELILTVGTMIRGGTAAAELQRLVVGFGSPGGGLEARVSELFGASTWQAIVALRDGNRPLADAIRFQAIVSEPAYRLAGQQLVALLHTQGRDSVLAMAAAYSQANGGSPITELIDAASARIPAPLREVLSQMLRGEQRDTLEVLTLNSLGIYNATGTGPLTIRVQDLTQAFTAYIGQEQAPVHERLQRRMAMAGFTGSIQEFLEAPENAAAKTTYEQELRVATLAATTRIRALINRQLGSIPALSDAEREMLPPGIVDDALTRIMLRRGSDGVVRPRDGMSWPEEAIGEGRARGLACVCFVNLILGAESGSLNPQRLPDMLATMMRREGMIATSVEQRARFEGPNGYRARTQQNINRWQRDFERAETERREMCEFGNSWNPYRAIIQPLATHMCGSDALVMFDANVRVASNQRLRYANHLHLLDHAAQEFDAQFGTAVTALRAASDIAMLRGGNDAQLTAAQESFTNASQLLMRRHQGQVVGRLDESIDMSRYHNDMNYAAEYAAKTYNNAVAVEGYLRTTQKMCILVVSMSAGPLGGVVMAGLAGTLLSATCHSLEGAVAVYGAGFDSERVWSDARGRFGRDLLDISIGAATGGLGRLAGARLAVKMGAQVTAAGSQATRLGRLIHYVGEAEKGMAALSYSRHLFVHGVSALVSSNSYFAANQIIQHIEVGSRFQAQFGSRESSGLSQAQYDERRTAFFRQHGLGWDHFFRSLATTNALGILAAPLATHASRASFQFQRAEQLGQNVTRARNVAMAFGWANGITNAVTHVTAPVLIHAGFETFYESHRPAETANGNRLGVDNNHNVLVVNRDGAIVAVWSPTGANLLDQPGMRQRYARLSSTGAILDASGRPVYMEDGRTTLGGRLYQNEKGQTALLTAPPAYDTSPEANAQRRAYDLARGLTRLELASHSFQENVLTNPHILISLGQSLGGMRILRSGQAPLAQRRSENSEILRAGRYIASTRVGQFVGNSRPIQFLSGSVTNGRTWLLGPPETGTGSAGVTPVAGVTATAGVTPTAVPTVSTTRATSTTTTTPHAPTVVPTTTPTVATLPSPRTRTAPTPSAPALTLTSVAPSSTTSTGTGTATSTATSPPTATSTVGVASLTLPVAPARKPSPIDWDNALVFAGGRGMPNGVVSDVPSSPLHEVLARTSTPRLTSGSAATMLVSSNALGGAKSVTSDVTSSPLHQAIKNAQPVHVNGDHPGTPGGASKGQGAPGQAGVGRETGPGGRAATGAQKSPPLATSIPQIAKLAPPPVQPQPQTASAGGVPPRIPPTTVATAAPFPEQNGPRYQPTPESQRTVGAVRLLERQARALTERHSELERQQVREQDNQRRETHRQRRVEVLEQLPGVLRQLEQQSGALVRTRQEQLTTVRGLLAQNPTDVGLQRQVHNAERRVMIAELRQLRAAHALENTQHQQRGEQLRGRAGSERALERHEIGGFQSRSRQLRQEQAQLERWKAHEERRSGAQGRGGLVAGLERDRQRVQGEREVLLASARVYSAERRLAAHDRVATRSTNSDPAALGERRLALRDRLTTAQLAHVEATLDRVMERIGSNPRDVGARAALAKQEGYDLQRTVILAERAVIRSERTAAKLATGPAGESTAQREQRTRTAASVELARSGALLHQAKAQRELSELRYRREPSLSNGSALNLARLREASCVTHRELCRVQRDALQDVRGGRSYADRLKVEGTVAEAQRANAVAKLAYLEAHHADLRRSQALARADRNEVLVSRLGRQLESNAKEQRAHRSAIPLAQLTIDRVGAEQRYVAAAKSATDTSDRAVTRQRQQVELEARNAFHAARRAEIEAKLSIARSDAARVTPTMSSAERASRQARVRTHEAELAHLEADVRIRSQYQQRAEARIALADARERVRATLGSGDERAFASRNAALGAARRLLALERDIHAQQEVSRNALSRRMLGELAGTTSASRRAQLYTSLDKLNSQQRAANEQLRQYYTSSATFEKQQAQWFRRYGETLLARLNTSTVQAERIQLIRDLRRAEVAQMNARQRQLHSERELLRGQPAKRDEFRENTYQLRMLSVERLQVNARRHERMLSSLKLAKADQGAILRAEGRMLVAQQRALLQEGAILLRSKSGLGAATMRSADERVARTRTCIDNLQKVTVAQINNERALCVLRTAALRTELNDVRAQLKAGKGTLGKEEQRLLGLRERALKDQIEIASLPLLTDRLSRLQACAIRVADLRALIPDGKTRPAAVQMQALLDKALADFRRIYSAAGVSERPLGRLARSSGLFAGPEHAEFRAQLTTARDARVALQKATNALAEAQQKFNSSWLLGRRFGRWITLRAANRAVEEATSAFYRAENEVLTRNIEVGRQWGLNERTLAQMQARITANHAALAAGPASRHREFDQARAELSRMRELVREHANSADPQIVNQRRQLEAMIAHAQRDLVWAPKADRWYDVTARYAVRLNQQQARAVEAALRETVCVPLRARIAELSKPKPGISESAQALRAAELREAQRQLARHEPAQPKPENPTESRASSPSPLRTTGKWVGRGVTWGLLGYVAYELYSMKERVTQSGLFNGGNSAPLQPPQSIDQTIYALLNNLTISTELRDSQLMELLQTHFVMASHEELLEMRRTLIEEQRRGAGPVRFRSYMDVLGSREFDRRIRLQRINNSQRRLHGLQETPLVDTWWDSIRYGEAGGF